MAAFLQLSNVSKRYGGAEALSGVDFTVQAGATHGLIGENGSGKSTLIKIICGIERPEPGAQLQIDGRPAPLPTPAAAKRLGVEVIYQDLALFPNLSVAENIALPAETSRPLLALARSNWRKAAARRALSSIGHDLPLAERVENLSVSERQLVAIARAIAGQARLVIMDEPTAALTRAEVDRLLAVIRALAGRGVAVVFVSHRLGEIEEIADEVTVLRDGKLTGRFSGRVDARALSEALSGRHYDYQPPPPPAAPAALIETKGLAKKGQFENVDLMIRPGEIVGLVGRLGAGRTELALALFGMSRTDAGQILWQGEPIALGSVQQAIGLGIGYVPEDRLALGLALDQPVADNVILTVLDRLKRRLGLISPAARRATAARWLKRLAVKASPALPAKALSGGNQQRVVIAKWLAAAPRLLILDNPTVGVDIGARDGIYRLIRELAAEGVAILLISDEISEATTHSHRVLTMAAGRITHSFAAGETSEAEIAEAVHG